MRKIKFRGWDEEIKQMFKPVYFDNLEVWWWNPETDDSEILGDISEKGILRHIILMQLTGLKDKNGVEIYEGDILDFDEKEWGGQFKPEVMSLDNLIGEWGYCGVIGDVKQWRSVIGNIHENPGLLK